jgi:hypothetical protein
MRGTRPAWIVAGPAWVISTATIIPAAVVAAVIAAVEWTAIAVVVDTAAVIIIVAHRAAAGEKGHADQDEGGGQGAKPFRKSCFHY